MKRSVIIWHVVFRRPGHTLELYPDGQTADFGIPGTLHVITDGGPEDALREVTCQETDTQA